MENPIYADNTSILTNDANFNFFPGLYRSVGANYVISADAWKLRELSVAYDFPRSWVSPTKVIKAASITVSGRNLIMLRPSTNKWTDPEFSEDTGNDLGRTLKARRLQQEYSVQHCHLLFKSYKEIRYD